MGPEPTTDQAHPTVAALTHVLLAAPAVVDGITANTLTLQEYAAMAWALRKIACALEDGAPTGSMGDPPDLPDPAAPTYPSRHALADLLTLIRDHARSRAFARAPVLPPGEQLR